MHQSTLGTRSRFWRLSLRMRLGIYCCRTTAIHHLASCRLRSMRKQRSRRDSPRTRGGLSVGLSAVTSIDGRCGALLPSYGLPSSYAPATRGTVLALLHSQPCYQLEQSLPREAQLPRGACAAASGARECDLHEAALPLRPRGGEAARRDGGNPGH